MKKVVIALGGNALQARGEAATSENEHPPGITGFTDKQHHEMDPKKQ